MNYIFEKLCIDDMDNNDEENKESEQKLEEAELLELYQKFCFINCFLEKQLLDETKLFEEKGYSLTYDILNTNYNEFEN